MKTFSPTVKTLITCLESGVVPYNAINNIDYNGVNVWILRSACLLNNWSEMSFATFSQVKKNKAKVVKGYKGLPIILSTTRKITVKENDKDKIIHVPYYKSFKVFNISSYTWIIFLLS